MAMTNFGIGHLVVEPAHAAGHLEVDRAGHDHQVGLPRRGPEGAGAEAVDVEARGAGRHHLDGAAGQAERHRPHARLARPVDGLLQRRGDDALFKTSFQPAHYDTPPYLAATVRDGETRSHADSWTSDADSAGQRLRRRLADGRRWVGGLAGGRSAASAAHPGEVAAPPQVGEADQQHAEEDQRCPEGEPGQLPAPASAVVLGSLQSSRSVSFPVDRSSLPLGCSFSG